MVPQWQHIIVASTFVLAAAGPAAAQGTTAPPGSQTRTTDGRHELAVGGRMGGSTWGPAGSARYWRTPKWGVEGDVWRHCVELGGDREFHVWQFAALGLYSLADRYNFARGDFQVRPYVGGGLNFYRAPSEFVLTDESATRVGLIALGGAELILKPIQPIVISGDVGFHQRGTFARAEAGGLVVAVAGHLYFK